LTIEFHGERSGIMLFRKFFSWYTREMAAMELKDKALRAGTRDEMLRLIDEVQASYTGGDRCQQKKYDRYNGSERRKNS